jgi:hypothetical protein
LIERARVRSDTTCCVRAALASHAMRDTADCETLRIEPLALLGNAREIWIFGTCCVWSTAEDSARATSECRRQEPVDGASSVPSTLCKKIW